MAYAANEPSDAGNEALFSRHLEHVSVACTTLAAGLHPARTAIARKTARDFILRGGGPGVQR